MTNTQERDPPAWRSAAEEVESLRDGLGRKVDEGIKPIVIALRACGLGTVGSCEGHGQRGAAPYVNLTTPVSPPVPKSQWKTIGIRNAELRARIDRLLHEFYLERTPPTPAARLTTKAINPYGVIALRPTGLVGGRRDGTRLHQEIQFLAEFNAFAEFLQNLPASRDHGQERETGDGLARQT